jgi:hypothetical protein
MILCAHSDAGFLNENISHSHARAPIFLSENKLLQRFNGAALSIAQIIKFVMASAAKSEVAALFVTTREMIPHRQTLISMGWPKPKSPIQTDNLTATGITSKTIVLLCQNDEYALLVLVALLPCYPRLILLLLGCWL